MPRLPLPVLAIAFLSLGFNQAHSSNCPTNYVKPGGFGPDVITTAASFDSLWIQPGADLDTIYASYDLRAGHLDGRNRVLYPGFYNDQIGVWDEYTAVSSTQTSGTIPLRLQVLIYGEGSIYGGNSGNGATVRVTKDNNELFSETHYFPGAPIWNRIYNLELSIPLGVPFRLGYELDIFTFLMGGSGPAQAQVRFGFAYPPDVTITSCQGFVQDHPVPAQIATWGSLKARYR